MTKTEIANIALAKFREGRITNIESDTDSVAVVMNDQYDHALELLLEEHRWNFAAKRVTLTQLSDKPPFGWQYQYQLPSDLIRLKDVNGEDVEASSRLFSLEGNALLTNDDKVTITYVAKITDVNLFSPSFVECLAFKLASITCGRLTGDTDLAMMLDRQYNQALSKSVHNDTKSAGSREGNLMQRMMGSSAILGGTYAAYRNATPSSSSSSSSGSVASHKHEVTDLLQTGASDGQVLAWNDSTETWEASTVAGTGDVVGGSSSTNNAVARYDGTTGKLIQDSSVTIDDSGNISASNISGTNTGDQDLSALATKANVLELNNTTAFTPDADYEPATKKYVDDNSGGGGSSTNLGYTASSTDGTVTSSSGTDATLPLADASDAGLLAPADFTKLGNQSGTNTGDESTASTTLQGIVEIATQTEINTGLAVDSTKAVTPWYLRNSEYYSDRIANNAKLTADETNVVAALDGATITDAGTPATDDKVLIQDTSDSDNLKYVNISDLPSGGGGGGASVSVSDTAPTSPSAGDLWFDSTTAKMYVYYNDGNSNQWVSVTSGLPTPDSKTGWMDYNDSTGSFSVAADTWTNVPNNGAGSFTNKTYKPPSVTEVIDTTTGHLDFSDLPLGSELILRNDITIVPNSNNALLQMRYVLGTGANEYSLNFLNDRLDSGSGVSYQKVNTFPIYMGDTNTKNNAGKLQIKLSVAGTVTNSGVYASIQLY